jgi:site-specific recombinase XerD
MNSLAPWLENFFTARLVRQRRASPHTVAAYRDTFRLLLHFAQKKTGTAPSDLTLEQLDAPLIGAFLDYLELERRCCPRTRNARLAAIHSFFRFLAPQCPEHSALIQRVLAIPSKRCDRAVVTYLTTPETQALLAQPNRQNWIGRRDHLLMVLALQTGLRLAELIQLRCQDLILDKGPHVRCSGKGRKERCTPLTRETVAVLRTWLTERKAQPTDFLFPTRQGDRLSHDAVQRRIGIYARQAETICPALKGKRISPHVLRHTSAMQLLQAGADTTVIALWLGHESIETTQIYIHADLSIKERALARTAPRQVKGTRYRPPDRLLSFLEAI